MKCPAMILLAMLAAAIPASPADIDRLASDAEGSFNEAKAMAAVSPDLARSTFRVAGEGYAAVAKIAPDPAAAHYNAGNSFMFAGEIGEAVYHYRMAQISQPFDPNIAHNLRDAWRQVLDSVSVKPGRSFADLLAHGARYLPPWLRALLFAVGYLMVFTALLWLLVRGKSIFWKRAAWVGGVVALLAAFSLFAEWWVCQGGRDGVVIAEEVVGRIGNGDIYDWAFTTPLHAGVEFRLLERRDDWVRIQLWNGDEGWLPESSIRVIGM